MEVDEVAGSFFCVVYNPGIGKTISINQFKSFKETISPKIAFTLKAEIFKTKVINKKAGNFKIDH